MESIRSQVGFLHCLLKQNASIVSLCTQFQGNLHDLMSLPCHPDTMLNSCVCLNFCCLPLSSCSDWVKLWRAYIQQGSSKRAAGAAGASASHPPPLREAIQQLMCPCHPNNPMLAVRPPHIANRRGRYAVLKISAVCVAPCA